jgi:hypothetical protein
VGKTNVRRQKVCWVCFPASDFTYHSVPEFYLDMALEIDPGLTILRSSTDPNTLELTALDCAFLWGLGIMS